MDEIQTFLEDVKRALNAAPDQRLYNKGSIRDRMKWMEQNKLIEALKQMNLQELRYCMGCGIPGSANTEAIRLVQIRRKEFDKFLEMQSRKKLELDAQEKQSPHQTVTVSTEDKDSWSENDASETKGSRLSKALQSFKEGREGDL